MPQLYSIVTNIWPQTNAPLYSGANYFWAEARNNLVRCERGIRFERMEFNLTRVAWHLDNGKLMATNNQSIYKCKKIGGVKNYVMI